MGILIKEKNVNIDLHREYTNKKDKLSRYYEAYPRC